MGAPTILISHTPDGGCTSACPTIAVPDCEDAALQAAESALAAAASATQASASAQTASSASESANAAVAGVLLAASNANTSAGQAASSASAASQSASAAAGSASTASASASTATARATQAAGSASSAASSATSAQTSAEAAATSAQTSTTKAAAAAASATAALASEATAHENAVATAADRVAVAADKQVAELSKEAAQLSATEAAQSAFSAAQSAANAATAGAVAGEAAGAAAGAAAAQPFASAASDSADEAAAQADIATTQAGVAAEQAGIATTQADLATTQAGIATTQAGLAEGSATSAAASALQAAAVGVSLVAPYLGGKAPRGGIVSAGTSAVGTTQDNSATTPSGLPGLAFGTSNLTPGVWARANWSTASVFLLSKSVGGVGVQFRVINSVPRLTLGNGSTNVNFIGTAAAAVADGSWVLWNVTINRAGLATFYANAVQVGNPVDISSIAAQTFTNAAALTWFSDGGTNHSAGTIGECWIVAGLLSASRIADIYRAGSIAPFCVMTPNTTTGQNTATIDGLSFFQWLDFGQGYGPIIRDRSGNNQHALMGTTGLFHAVRKNPPGVPARAPKSALVFDGSAGSRVGNTLNAQNASTGEMLLWWDGVFPILDSSARAFASLTSSTSTTYQPRALELVGNSTSGLYLILHGATTDDTRRLIFANLHTHLAGKRCVLVAGRGVLYVGAEGDFFNATNLASTVLTGTPPAWTDEIDGDYLSTGYRTAAISTAQTLYDLRLANVAMTEAQLRAEYERGEPGPEWVGASKTNLFAGWTFLSGWTALSATVVDADTFTTAGAGGVIWSGLQKGAKYRITAAWSTTASSFDIRDYGTGIVLLTASGSTVEFVAQSSQLYIRNGGAGITDVSALTLERIGWTTRLRTDTTNGRQAVNDAKSATNDASHFTTSATGITVSPEPKRTEHSYSQASLTANGELLDTAGVIATDAVLVDVVVKNTTANEVTGFGIGMSSGVRDLTHETDIPANAVVVLPIKRADLAGCTVGTSPYGRIYYSAAVWNSGNLNISIRYRRERDLL
jgi:hypothetical protein